METKTFFLLFKLIICVVIKRDLQDEMSGLSREDECQFEGSYYESQTCKCSNILNGATLLSKNSVKPKCLGTNTVTDEAECESFVYQNTLSVCPKASITKVELWELNESFRGIWSSGWNAVIKPMLFINSKNNIKMNTTNALWDGLLIRIWYTCSSFNTKCILVKTPGERTYPLFQNYGNNILMTNYSAIADVELISTSNFVGTTKQTLASVDPLFKTSIKTKINTMQNITIERGYQDKINVTRNCSTIDAINENFQCKCNDINKGGTFLLFKNSSNASCLGEKLLGLALGCNNIAMDQSNKLNSSCLMNQTLKILNVYVWNHHADGGFWDERWSNIFAATLIITEQNEIMITIATKELWHGLINKVIYQCSDNSIHCIVTKFNGIRTYPLGNFSQNSTIEVCFSKIEGQKYNTRKIIITCSLVFISISIVMSVIFLVRKNLQQKKLLNEEAKVNDAKHYESATSVETVDYKTLEPDYQVLEDDFTLTENTTESNEYSYAYGTPSTPQNKCLQIDKEYSEIVEPTYYSTPLN
ncbi:uncharacterized protein LOC101234608 isoform X2 [Hydra vulgaris]|uniref:Uncharacterized protein LOC101234608 isoform X2 n=1 Tax=Hydra vulgaris TaxID=6087 RepID=A0ABM4CTN1_HYDVU